MTKIHLKGWRLAEEQHPAWTADGTGIYYRAGTAIVKARISKGPSVRVIGRDTVVKNMSNMLTSALNRQYEVARDGRFLGRVSDTGDYQLIVVPNWKAELDQKLARRAKR